MFQHVKHCFAAPDFADELGKADLLHLFSMISFLSSEDRNESNSVLSQRESVALGNRLTADGLSQFRLTFYGIRFMENQRFRLTGFGSLALNRISKNRWRITPAWRVV
jgi:hypothetical protein